MFFSVYFVLQLLYILPFPKLLIRFLLLLPVLLFIMYVELPGGYVACCCSCCMYFLLLPLLEYFLYILLLLLLPFFHIAAVIATTVVVSPSNVAVVVVDFTYQCCCCWLTDCLAGWRLVLPLFVACFRSRIPLLAFHLFVYTGQCSLNFQLQWVTEADAALGTSPLTVCTFYSPLPISAPSAPSAPSAALATPLLPTGDWPCNALPMLQLPLMICGKQSSPQNGCGRPLIADWA